MTTVDRLPREGIGARPATDVALFMPTLDGGGAERVQLILAAYLLGQGLRVDVVVCKRVGALRDKVPPGARLIDLAARRVLLSLPRYECYLAQARPRTVISSVENASVIACAARARGAHPHRLIVRQDNALVAAAMAWGEPRRWAWLLVLAISYRYADHVIAVSDGVERQLKCLLRKAKPGVSRVYNPVILPDFADRLRAGPNSPYVDLREPLIAAAGRLHPVKDYSTLLRAFASLRRSGPARLVIMGEGEQRGELEALAARLEIAQDVEFAGFVDDPLPVMHRSDVFVLSSSSEGLGGALIEALAAGTRVVSTDCRHGPREILGGGQFGLLVPVGDAEALAAAIGRALAAPRSGPTPHLQDHLARFSLDHVGQAYLSLVSDPPSHARG